MKQKCVCDASVRRLSKASNLCCDLALFGGHVTKCARFTMLFRKNRFKPLCIRLVLTLLIVASPLAYSEPPTPSIFCGALHGYVCTPEQAFAEQRRQMQRRDSSARSEGQQAYARWFYLQQIQRQRMEFEALVPTR